MRRIYPLKKAKTEKELEGQLANFIRSTYPDVIFFFDFSAGLYLSKQAAIASSNRRSCTGLPDLYILQKSKDTRYNALFLELKKDGSAFKKDGKLRSSEHHKEQFEVHKRLQKQGYNCVFSEGYEASRYLIINHLGTPTYETVSDENAKEGYIQSWYIESSENEAWTSKIGLQDKRYYSIFNPASQGF